MSAYRLNPDRLAALPGLMAEMVPDPYPTGLLVLANAHETVWSHRVPGVDRVWADSIFLLASITKPIVATAVMRLVESGRLLLHVPVATYLPAFAANGKARVTPWHLLTHTSGLEEESVWRDMPQRPDAGRAALLEMACAAPLHFEPGDRCEYCSLSFDVLAELITQASGRPYAVFLQDEIFAPLGMTSTGFQPPAPARALPVHDFGGPERTAGFSSLATAGGGLWSSAADLVRFGQAFLRGGHLDGYRLLSPAALALMTRLHTAGLQEWVDGRPHPYSYGLGWRKIEADGSSLADPAAYRHGGATGTELLIDPAYDLVSVFLTNRWDVETDTRQRLVNAVYGAFDLV